MTEQLDKARKKPARAAKIQEAIAFDPIDEKPEVGKNSQAEKEENGKRKEKKATKTITEPIKKSYIISSFLTRIQSFIAPPILHILASIAIIILLACLSQYFTRKLISNFYESFPAVPSFSILSPVPLISQVGALYCSTIGIGCSVDPAIRRNLVHTARIQTEIALDIFDSILSISPDRSAISSLNHVAIWELATAVGASSDFQSKNFLSTQLNELGDLTRDVRDSSISLNSLGINAFSWIYHEFTRLQEIILLKETAQIENLLESLFERISRDLNQLLLKLDQVIPIADRASHLGGRLLYDLSFEQNRLVETVESESIIKKLLLVVGVGSAKSYQLRRDVTLSGDSVEWIKNTRMGLERARSGLIQYRDNVGHFKAGITGYHLADHNLSAREEVLSLNSIMIRFKETLSTAKESGKLAVADRKAKLLAIEGSR